MDCFCEKLKTNIIKLILSLEPVKHLLKPLRVHGFPPIRVNGGTVEVVVFRVSHGGSHSFNRLRVRERSVRVISVDIREPEFVCDWTRKVSVPSLPG